jgi:hypothetical protein
VGMYAWLSNCVTVFFVNLFVISIKIIFFD